MPLHYYKKALSDHCMCDISVRMSVTETKIMHLFCCTLGPDRGNKCPVLCQSLEAFSVFSCLSSSNAADHLLHPPILLLNLSPPV